MPMGCYVLVFFRALAEVLVRVFLKMVRVCIGMERPGAAKTRTQARGRRHCVTRKGKDVEKMKSDPPSTEVINPVAPALHSVSRPSEMLKCTKYACSIRQVCASWRACQKAPSLLPNG